MTRILVIEDEQPILENIVETLSLNDFEVAGASNGEEGIELAKEYQPDIILCDIMMPGIDGYEVLHTIRKSNGIALTPFIFLTAKSDRTSMRYGMELGADDYIPKPFTTDELLRAIQSRVERFETVVDETNENLVHTKKQLAHVISHELRTPLTSINMAVQLMAQQLDFLSTDDIQDLVHTLGNGTGRLNRLVEQISMFVEAQSGLMTREKVQRASRPESLWALILGGISRANHFIYRDNNVNVNFDGDSTQDLEVECFLSIMNHAIAELVSNAIAFSPEYGQVEVSVKRYDRGVRIKIADQGDGMAPEQIELALQEFTQIDREVYEQQGIGIGLPLSNFIIEAHGGRLDIQSKKGQGTDVLIYLPYTQS